MKRFEYTTFVFEPNGENAWYLDETLNNLGKDGWKLVTAATDNSVDDGDTYTEFIYYTLKREWVEE